MDIGYSLCSLLRPFQLLQCRWIMELEVLRHRPIRYILKTKAMLSITTLELNDSIMMSKDGVDPCFNIKDFLALQHLCSAFYASI